MDRNLELIINLSYGFFNMNPVNSEKINEFIEMMSNLDKDYHIDKKELFKVLETKHLITIKELNHMRKDSFLINIARGPIVKESDLIKALEGKIIAGCALDVYEFEPNYDLRLAKMDNVVLTPHAGSASVNARTGMVELAAQNIESFFLKNKVLNPVNIIN